MLDLNTLFDAADESGFSMANGVAMKCNTPTMILLSAWSSREERGFQDSPGLAAVHNVVLKRIRGNAG